MADRRTHNTDARNILGKRITWKEIDEVNAKIDSTVKEKGYKHREDFHDLNPFKADSIEVTGGDIRKEIVRQIHIARDTDPVLKELGKLQQALRLIK